MENHLLDKSFDEYSEKELELIAPMLHNMSLEIVRLHWLILRNADEILYLTTFRRGIYAAARDFPPHHKNNMLSELVYAGFLTGLEADVLRKKKDVEVLAIVRSRMAEMKSKAHAQDDRIAWLRAHPILPIVTKDLYRIDSDVVQVFEMLIHVRLTGEHTELFLKEKRPTWKTCYEVVVRMKDGDGSVKYQRCRGDAKWTVDSLCRMFHSWCRHFGFKPSDITSEYRPDIAAIEKMREA